MAQVNDLGAGFFGAKNETVTISTLTKILAIPARYLSFLGVEVVNEGAGALTAFQIRGRMHKDGAMQVMFSAATDFTTPAGLVVDASGDLTILSSGQSGWVALNVLPLVDVEVWANSAGTDISVRASGKL